MRNYWLYEYVSEAWATTMINRFTAKLITSLYAQSLREHDDLFRYDYMSCTIAQCSWMGGWKQVAGDLWVALKYSNKDRVQTVTEFCEQREERQRLYGSDHPHIKGEMAAVKRLRKALNRKYLPENHATQNK